WLRGRASILLTKSCCCSVVKVSKVGERVLRTSVWRVPHSLTRDISSCTHLKNTSFGVPSGVTFESTVNHPIIIIHAPLFSL
uniref:Uncharacterized protein n=1 Tax=Sparus aurata TaxID=8175 RepID=A0A671YQ27_SPAAU